jgi:amidohydrolase
MIPETALKEYKTSDYIANELENMGITVKRAADTGMSAVLAGDFPGKTIALRADIDALPISENNDVDYKSRHEGCMHACGHDGHAAMALGAAKILYSMRNELHGNVKFIFQPAEEQYGGAKRMIDAGVLENPDVDAILALHLWPDFKKGEICLKDGCIMASNDKMEIRIKGSGGHGAMPHLCTDALAIGCQIVSAVQLLLSREINAVDSVVITFGTFKAGTSYNIVADEAVITGTVRTVDEKSREKVKNRLEEIIAGVCQAFGATYEFDFINQYPVTINNNDFNIFLKDIADCVNDNRNVVKFDKPYMTGEDFSYYLHRVKGSMCFIGTSDDEFNHPLHNPNFNFDESVLCTGASFLAAAAINYLNGR